MNLSSIDQALDAIFRWTCATTLFASVLIALVLLLQAIFGRVLPARWRYALGLLVLLRLALPVAPASSWSIFNLEKQLLTQQQPARTFVTTSLTPVAPLSTTLPKTSVVLTSSGISAIPSGVAPASRGSLSASRRQVFTTNPPPTQPLFTLRATIKYLWLLGVLAMLLTVARRHQKFSAALRSWEPVREPRVLELLVRCQVMLGIQRRVIVLAAEGLNTPALFGFFRPRLLVPAEMLHQLSDRELRHIFLHELVHLRRGDVLINWAMIFLRALHWFNPAVWLAFRRLRADQELACDAAVLARLDAGEQLQYGGTLVKLLADFSAGGLCLSAVPFATNKQIIKHRIKSIAAFRPAGRLAAIASCFLLASLVCVTFTGAAPGPASMPVLTRGMRIGFEGGRAFVANDSNRSEAVADRITFGSPDAAGHPGNPVVLTLEPDGTLRVGQDSKTISRDGLKKILEDAVARNPDTGVRIRPAMAGQSLTVSNWVFEVTQQTKVKWIEIARALEASSSSSSSDAANRSTQEELTSRLASLDAQISVLKQRVQSSDYLAAQNYTQIPQQVQAQITAAAQRIGEKESLLSELNNLSAEELRQALPTILPDPLLTDALRDLSTAQSKVVELASSRGPSNPEVISAREVLGQANSNVTARVKGILKGIQIQIDADRDLIQRLKAQLSNNAEKTKYDEFIQLKDQLDKLEQSRNELRRKLGAIGDPDKSALQSALDKAMDEYAMAKANYPAGSPLLEVPHKRVDDLTKELNDLESVARTPPPSTTNATDSRDVAALRQELAKIDLQVAAAKSNVTAMHEKIIIHEGFGQPAPENPLQPTEAQINVAKATLAKMEQTLTNVDHLGVEEQCQVLFTNHPDAILESFLKDLHDAQAKLAQSSTELGPNHPDMITIKNLIKTRLEQINSRVDGALGDLRVQAESMRVRIDDAQHFASYYEAKDKLDQLLKLHDVLQYRIDEEQLKSSRTDTNSR